MLNLDNDRLQIAAELSDDAALLAVPVSADDLAAGRPAELIATLEQTGFTGEIGQTAVVAGADGVTRVAFGVGAALTALRMRRGAMPLGEQLRATIALDLRDQPAERQGALAAAFAEGAILGSYRWARAAGSEPAGPELRVAVAADQQAEAAAVTRRAAVRARAANWARRLTDTPPSQLTPADLAAVAGGLADSYGWASASLAGDQLLERGLGAIHAVGAGSSRPVQLIDLTYRGRGDGAIDVVVIGKGVTFDGGGVQVKTERPISAVMKSDMAGGAAALATLAAVATLELPLNVRVLVPAVENLLGPGAMLAGDVVTHYGGRTTEVSCTDAEGRLLLADCLALAAEENPEATLIDIGTLSEAPFSPSGWTLVSPQDWLAGAVARCAESVGEHGVRVPNAEGHERWIASTVADSKNANYPFFSQDLMTAAAYLRPFAGTSDWVHLDVCAVAYLYDGWATWPQGATGCPTRPLVELLSGWDSISRS